MGSRPQVECVSSSDTVSVTARNALPPTLSWPADLHSALAMMRDETLPTCYGTDLQLCTTSSRLLDQRPGVSHATPTDSPSRPPRTALSQTRTRAISSSIREGKDASVAGLVGESWAYEYTRGTVLARTIGLECGSGGSNAGEVGDMSGERAGSCRLLMSARIPRSVGGDEGGGGIMFVGDEASGLDEVDEVGVGDMVVEVAKVVGVKDSEEDVVGQARCLKSESWARLAWECATSGGRVGCAGVCRGVGVRTGRCGEPCGRWGCCGAGC